MRGIKIDVIKKEIYEIEIGTGWQDITKALDCEIFDRITLMPSESLFVDDNGLLKEEPLGAFKIGEQIISGHGLILGIRTPNICSTALTLDVLKNAVTFVPVSELPDPTWKFFNF